METVWGVTDDMVTLSNNSSYYFFKIPHKVTEIMRLFCVLTFGWVDIEWHGC